MNDQANKKDPQLILPGTPVVSTDETYSLKTIPNKTPKKNYTKKIISAVGLMIIGYLLYSIIHLFVSPDRQIQQIYLVPEDATFIIQSSDPVNDWKRFSESNTWQALKEAKSIEEITYQINSLDSIVQSNKTLLSLIGKRDLLISLHKTQTTDWDFLILLDLQKMAKVDILKDQLENILKITGQTITYRTYHDIDILEMRDPNTRDILYIAFVDNHLVASYTSKLVQAAIDTRNDPQIGLDPIFIEAEKVVAGKGLVRVFINYKQLPKFMSIYLGNNNEYISLFCNSMSYAGLYFNTDKKKTEIKGQTFRNDHTDPYVSALLTSGKHTMKAHEIMSARTALYANIGMANPSVFVQELESILSEKDLEMYNSYKNSRKKIENLFGISLDKNFLSWMSGEFALSQSEPGLLGQEPEFILAIRAKSIKDARKNMQLIEKKVKNRTPIKIKSVEYKGYEINYIEMKGFFRPFFGGLFDIFEKPYYTYLDDYVVFSNKASTLLSLIEDYEQKNLLSNNPGFKKAYAYHNSASTIFMYTDIHHFFPQLQTMLNAKTWSEIKTNKEVLYSFPYWTMQIVGDNDRASLSYVMDYEPYTPETSLRLNIDPDEEDKEMAENAETEKELMSELKRFYVEKFQGNILRDFFSNGSLKSESEVKEGKRHGRYREYFENGKLKIRGKYVNNRPKGTWKYYTEEGKFERKQKY